MLGIGVRIAYLIICPRVISGAVDTMIVPYIHSCAVTVVIIIAIDFIAVARRSELKGIKCLFQNDRILLIEGVAPALGEIRRVVESLSVGTIDDLERVVGRHIQMKIIIFIISYSVILVAYTKSVVRVELPVRHGADYEVIAF